MQRMQRCNHETVYPEQPNGFNGNMQNKRFVGCTQCSRKIKLADIACVCQDKNIIHNGFLKIEKQASPVKVKSPHLTHGFNRAKLISMKK